MSLPFILLIALMSTVTALVLLQNWRITIPLLVAIDLCRIALIWQAPVVTDVTRPTILLMEIFTAIGVGLILLVTAITFTREYPTEQLDEFGLMELRRSARRAQQRRSQIGGQWSGYVVPIGALLLAALATWLLGRAYPVAHDPMIDAAWLFILLAGLLTLVTATDVLKLGLGLLLLAMSAKLLYFGVTSRINALHIALLELLSLLLVVIVAYLSGLLYSRLNTLEFDSLFEQR